MALTKAQAREILSAAGVDSEHMKEAVDKIIEGHVATVEALNEKINTYKADAEKLPAVQKELDELKAAGDGGYKQKYEDEKKAFEDFKKAQTEKETKASKEKAVRAFYESKGIKGKNLEIAIRASRAEIDGMELDGEKIKDTSVFDNLVSGDFSGMVETSTTTGANTSTPPANNNNDGNDPSKMSMEDYIAYRTKK